MKKHHRLIYLAVQIIGMVTALAQCSHSAIEMVSKVVNYGRRYPQLPVFVF